ncbi:pyroglutamyl-peptidase I family protein [Maricaulaceae bacterium MS644]
MTGFGPFPGAPVNPTEAVIAKAAAPDRMRTLVLSTQYDAVPGALDAAARDKPDVVVMTGLAAAAERVRIELLARNQVPPGRPDASGEAFDGGVIEHGGPQALETTADLPALFAALARADVEYEISRDAGGYVCNFAYFHALRRFAAARIVFVHLPLTETAFAASIRAGPGYGLGDGPAQQRILPEAEAVRAVSAILSSQLGQPG